jgi:hypothetical protein
VKWETLEDHTEGFRGSEEYQQWRFLLHHFYDPFPAVEHYSLVELSQSERMLSVSPFSSAELFGLDLALIRRGVLGLCLQTWPQRPL